ncbi:spore germination protein [Oceanobacillus kimchii]|uniref:GerAB/ArcD/ProY family transporter n=1 Tax=Oceanobacillus kimchii TaxID=746691 RepID=UPI0021A3B0B2|nr:spore germination protein [Oceanobacillus kimchii]MCT1578604.1 spore germination protein [Oceanobacillus kimchii]MCT2136347.1 spore germination protein [Oceanobacillus kimchii]
MDINVRVKPNLKINTFYLFFIITFIQIGVGLLGLQRILYEHARQDAWISLLIGLVYLFIIMYVMVIILRQYSNADILGIQVDIFGKWIGKFFGTIFIIHFAIALFTIVITYAQIIRVFMFPTLHPFVTGLLLVVLMITGVLGGLKVIVGVTFVFFFSSIWLLLLLIPATVHLDYTHYLPLFQASLPELLEGARATTYSYIGFEILLLIFPFLENKKTVLKTSLISAVWTTMVLLITTMIAIGFFSAEQLLRRDWSLLALFKIANITFIERFDFIVVAEWIMVLVPNMMLLMWAITFGLKRLYRIPQKATLYISSILILIGSIMVTDHYSIQRVINFSSQLGFWLIFVYPLVLLPIVLIKSHLRKKNRRIKA